MRVRATDTGHAWHVGTEGGRLQARREHGDCVAGRHAAACTVTGPASGVYLFLWNRSARPSATPAACTVTGPASGVYLFLGTARRRPGRRHDLRRPRLPRPVAVKRPRPLGLTSVRPADNPFAGLSYPCVSVKYMFDMLQPGSAPRQRLSDDPASRIPLERLEAQICELAGHLAAATCRFLVLLGDFDARRGWASWEMNSCAAWLSWKCQMSSGTAREHVRVARALRDLPVIRAEFGAGRLSYAKVRALTRIATPDTEAGLAEIAGPMTGEPAGAVRPGAPAGQLRR